MYKFHVGKTVTLSYSPNGYKSLVHDISPSYGERCSPLHSWSTVCSATSIVQNHFFKSKLHFCYSNITILLHIRFTQIGDNFLKCCWKWIFPFQLLFRNPCKNFVLFFYCHLVTFHIPINMRKNMFYFFRK